MELTLEQLLQDPERPDLLDPHSILSLIPGLKGEYCQYIEQVLAKIRDIEDYDWLEIPEPEGGCLGSWSPQQALAVLIYGSRSHLSVQLINEIERLTGETLPRSAGESRFEHSFRLAHLEPMLDGFKQRRVSVRIQPQFGCGPYRVDFRVRLNWTNPNDRDFNRRENWENYLLEFDEAFHLEPANRLRDKKRDRRIEQLTGLKPIRIRHQEQELWASICKMEQEILSVETYLKGLLEQMAWRQTDSYIDITRQSTLGAYMCDAVGYLRYPDQPKRDLKKIAERLGYRLSSKHSGNQAFHRLYIL